MLDLDKKKEEAMIRCFFFYLALSSTFFQSKLKQHNCTLRKLEVFFSSSLVRVILADGQCYYAEYKTIKCIQYT